MKLHDVIPQILILHTVLNLISAGTTSEAPKLGGSRVSYNQFTYKKNLSFLDMKEVRDLVPASEPWPPIGWKDKIKLKHLS